MRESYGVTELSCVLCGALQIYLCIHEKSHNYTSKENSQCYRLIKQDQRVMGISKGAVQEGEKIMQSPW